MNISYSGERYIDSGIGPNTLQEAITRLRPRSETKG